MSDMQNDEADADFLSASPAVRKLYDTGAKMANVDFSEIENRRKQALEEKKAALRRGYDALMAQKTDNSAEMLLSMSRGFLSPTRTGSFAESMGNVAGELSPALQRQREMERQHRAQAQQYETGIADVGAQQAQNEYDTLLKRAEAGRRLMERSASLASAEARARENREMRRDLAALAAGRDAGYHFDTIELGDEQAKRMGVAPGAYRVAIDKRDPSKMSLVGPAQNKQGSAPVVSPDERAEYARSVGVPFNPNAGPRNLSPKMSEQYANLQMKEAEKQLSGLREAIAPSRAAIADMDRFEQLMKSQSTGGVYGVPVVGAAARSIVGAFDPQISEMTAISNKIAPNMRPPGSGATSDYDARMFQSATVGPDKPRETNAAIIRASRMAHEDMIQKLKFFESYASAHSGSLRGAEEYWNQYLNSNPIFDPEKSGKYALNEKRQSWQNFFASKRAQPPAPAPAAPSAAPAAPPQGGAKFLGYE
jgi:hypothetical protein